MRVLEETGFRSKEDAVNREEKKGISKGMRKYRREENERKGKEI